MARWAKVAGAVVAVAVVAVVSWYATRATSSPTETPSTTMPTATPTAAPTTAPTAVPTVVPTAAPSAAPTTVPTAVPTAAPSAAPTAAPTTPPPVPLLLGMSGDFSIWGYWTSYKFVLHVQFMNPSSQALRGKKMQVVAHHGTIDGPVLYHFERDLASDQYLLQARAKATWDFELKPASETSFDILYHPIELLRLARESTAMEFPLGLDMNMTLAVVGGQTDQEVTFNMKGGLGSQLCLHLRPNLENCGDMPRMVPASTLTTILPIVTETSARSMVV